jgi:hypothetical protein
MSPLRQKDIRSGAQQERERISALLEEFKEYWSERVEFEYGTVSAINVDEAIALIKGENK